MPSCMRAPPDAVKMRRRAALDRRSHPRDDGFSGSHAERASLEPKVLNRYSHALTLELAEPYGDRIRGPGFCTVLLQAICIPFDVAKLERVRKHLRRRDRRVGVVSNRDARRALGLIAM